MEEFLVDIWIKLWPRAKTKRTSHPKIKVGRRERAGRRVSKGGNVLLELEGTPPFHFIFRLRRGWIFSDSVLIPKLGWRCPLKNTQTFSIPQILHLIALIPHPFTANFHANILPWQDPWFVSSENVSERDLYSRFYDLLWYRDNFEAPGLQSFDISWLRLFNEYTKHSCAASVCLTVPISTSSGPRPLPIINQRKILWHWKTAYELIDAFKFFTQVRRETFSTKPISSFWLSCAKAGCVFGSVVGYRVTINKSWGNSRKEGLEHLGKGFSKLIFLTSTLWSSGIFEWVN